MLKHIAENLGIQYSHMPELGIASDKRQHLETMDDYNALFAGYEKTLPSNKVPLERLYALIRSENRVALMCYEKEPAMCHRHVIRDYLVKTYGITAVDL
ncbi:hypothetical protein SDC9_190110 [bioreactor metagenome]|uniref:DUF488 domain-containing protein n=1 Tax=bioreactor metagenome TaxID=1076179 RepID=A0A645I500_9ZZZZ